MNLSCVWSKKGFNSKSLKAVVLRVGSWQNGFFADFYFLATGFFGVGFWQNGFFADFYFWAAGFFRGFSRRIFSPHFCGEKGLRKILQENPRQNPPKFIQQKSPTHFCRGAGPRFFRGVRGRHGGVEKGGGWKTSRMTPLPKRAFGTPLGCRYVFHPPSGVVALFFLYKNPRQSRQQKLFWRGPEFFGRARPPVRFPPPIRFAPPHITAQRSLSPDLFSSFLWEKVPRQFCRKIPGKLLQNLHNKNPRRISAEGPGRLFPKSEVPHKINNEHRQCKPGGCI